MLNKITENTLNMTDPCTTDEQMDEAISFADIRKQRNDLTEAVDFLIKQISVRNFQSDEVLDRKLPELIDVIARTLKNHRTL